MGHADLTNISTIFVDLLFKQKTVTVRQVVDLLVARGEAVHASEGLLEDRAMLGYSCENVLSFLLNRHGTTARTPDRKKVPVLEPVEPLTPRQEEILTAFCEGEIDEWGCGDDGEGGEYGELDNITFKLTEPWANIPRNRIPLLTRFEN